MIVGCALNTGCSAFCCVFRPEVGFTSSNLPSQREWKCQTVDGLWIQLILGAVARFLHYSTLDVCQVLLWHGKPNIENLYSLDACLLLGASAVGYF